MTIEEYLSTTVSSLILDHGIEITEDNIREVSSMISSSNMSFEEAKRFIDTKASSLINKKVKHDKILAGASEFYEGVTTPDLLNIQSVDISSFSYEELENVFFHFSLMKNAPSIDSQGIVAGIGRNSFGIDKKPAIYFSHGITGVLEAWDVWLKWRMNRLFNPVNMAENRSLIERIKNGTASESEANEFFKQRNDWMHEFISGDYKHDKEKLSLLYDYQLDEMLHTNYYSLALKEGTDFSFDEIDTKKEKTLREREQNPVAFQFLETMYGPYSDLDGSKVDSWNMNTLLGKDISIPASSITAFTYMGRSDIFSVIDYLYSEYKKQVPEDKQVRFDLLDQYLAYGRSKIAKDEMVKSENRPNSLVNRNSQISTGKIYVYFLLLIISLTVFFICITIYLIK